MAGKSPGRRRHTTEFKARVARDALRETDTLSAVAARHGVHPSQVRDWRKLFLEGGKAAFQNRTKQAADHESTLKDLYAKIGELTVERDFFQRALGR